MITPVEIEKIKDLLVTNYKPDKVILFGSYARGDANEESDLDILVLKSGLENVGPIERFSEASMAVRGPKAPEVWLRKIELDLHVLTPEEFRALNTPSNWFISSVLKEGITLYDRNNHRAVA